MTRDEPQRGRSRGERRGQPSCVDRGGKSDSVLHDVPLVEMSTAM